MNDKQERTEYQEALELDALLDNWLAGRSAAAKGATKLSVEDQTFARQVVSLAQETEPDPDFVLHLENRLRWAARQNAVAGRREVSPPHRLFWEQLKETFSRRSTFAAAGAIAVMAAFVLILWPILNPPDDNGSDTRVANIPTFTPAVAEAVMETESVEDTGDAAADMTAQESITVAPDVPLPITITPSPEIIAVITPTPTLDPSTLAKLPPLSGGSVFGLGGGGGAGGPGLGGGADESMMPTVAERLTGAQFNLNTTLPSTPTQSTVYQYQQTEPSLEQVREIGARFGFTGEVYTDAWYENALQNPEFGWPGPRTYTMFEGAFFFNATGNSFSYFDNSVITPGVALQQMSYEQALPIAEAWGRERGFLDFPYETVKSPFGEEVGFYRIINGVRANIAEFSVSLMENGRVLSAYYLPFAAYNPVADYPILSAEAAWELAQSEPDYQAVFVNLYPDPATLPPMPTPDPRYRSWYRTYQDGDPITVQIYPQVYLPVTEGEPVVVRGNEYFLTGDQALLDQIAAATDQNVRVTGTIVGNTIYGQQILVSAFELVPPVQEWQLKEGFIRRTEDGLVLLDTTQGETLLIPNAPDDLSEGEHVSVSGPLIEPGDPYPIFDWTNMDRLVEFEFIPEEEFIFPTPIPITQINIDMVELIYYYTPVPDPEYDGPGQDWYQPAWRFTGQTNSGELIEIIVQAVLPDLVLPVATPTP